MLQHTNIRFNPFLTIFALVVLVLSFLHTSPGVFLICWLPFFVTHILNTHCRTCYVPPGLYGAFTWLGYVNSALNPVIYTTFNIEFRRAFIKILSCWGRQRGRKWKWNWVCALMLQLCRGVFGRVTTGCWSWSREADFQEFYSSSNVEQEEKRMLWYAINANKRRFYFKFKLFF